jgi:hypothetical protein
MTRLASMRGGAVAQVLVALTLCGVLSAAAAGWRQAGARCSERDRARALVDAATRSVLEWQEHHPGRVCPRTLGEALPGGAAAALPRDPWGEPLVYRCPGPASGDGFDLSSTGPDRRAGTPDDIVGWE